MGETWELISSPPTALDFIYVKAFDPDLIFILDENGRLWSNRNSASLTEDAPPSINVYPVPSRDLLNIDVPEGSNPFNATLYDLSGRSYMSTSEKCIEISTLPKGVYLLVIHFGDHIINKKILKY